VLAPIVDCSTFSTPGTHQANVTGWACVLMVDPMQQGGNIDTVHLEYRGDSSLPGSPCATQGMPGASTGVGPLVPVLVHRESIMKRLTNAHRQSAGASAASPQSSSASCSCRCC
jgi:hypothetical protein